MKLQILAAIITVLASSNVFASPEKTKRQEPAPETQEYNVIPLEVEKRGVFRNGERTVYKDINNCPKATGYRCPVKVSAPGPHASSPEGRYRAAGPAGLD